MDSDLAEAVSSLRAAFEQRKLTARFGAGEPQEIDRLRKALRIPARFRAFLAEADPVDVESVTPIERVRLIPTAKLYDEQVGHAVPAEGAEPDARWRKSWIIVARSALLGDPYFLDVAKLDAEGDCPVYTAMTGTDSLKPTMCASSFQQFLNILATSMDVAKGFGIAVMDDDDERTFREMLASRIKHLDPAALRAGHWT